MSTQLAHTQAILASTQAISRGATIKIVLYNNKNETINELNYIIEGSDNYRSLIPAILETIRANYNYSYSAVSIVDNYNSNNSKIIPQSYITFLENNGWNIKKYPIITINNDGKTLRCEKCGINLVTLTTYRANIKTANCRHYNTKVVLTRNGEERIKAIMKTAMDNRTVTTDIKGNKLIVVSANDIEYYSTICDYDIDDYFQDYF